MQFVAEVGFGLAGFRGLDAPSARRGRRSVGAAFAAGPGPDSGAVDGVGAAVWTAGGHGGVEEPVEDVLQQRRPARPRAVRLVPVWVGSSMAATRVNSRRTWGRVTTARCGGRGPRVRVGRGGPGRR